MSDNLDAYPVHRRESVNVGGTIPTNVRPNSELYTNQDIYKYGIHGPFLQTLFLGCSVVNFNVNLGWGSDASSLSVSLVEDTSNHWMSPQSVSRNNQISVNNNLSRTSPLLDINTKKTFGVAIDPVTSQEYVAGFSTAGNIAPDLHTNINLKEEQKFNEATDDNLDRSLATPPRPDYGKVYYELFYNGTYNKKYWTGPDPGFVGESYDILGTPVRFIFNEFEFIGIVTSWKNNGGSSGKNLYTVEIKSMASLLKNTQLIIDHYPGTIFRASSSIPSPFGLLNRFGMPSNNIGDRVGQAFGLDATLSDYNEADFVGKIAEGNIPNVFNVYGYLQTVDGWGKHDINEQGTLANDILGSIDDLINNSQSAVISPDQPQQPLLIDARFSPYGRILGKAPALIKDPNNIWSTDLPSGSIVRFLTDIYTTVNPLSHEFYKLTEVEIDPPTNGIASYQTLSRVDYTQNRYSNTQPLNLNHMGLLPAYTSSDGSIKQQYTLDITDLPTVPKDYRVKGPVISILDFVQNICDINNYDFFVDFESSGNAIKIRTVSRQNQPPNNYISQLIKNSTATDSITSYDYGLEFNDSANIRSLYVGAKQQRLLQVSSNLLSRKNNGLLFDAKEGMTLDHSLDDIKNVIRAPDHFSVRNPIYQLYQNLNNISAIRGSGTGAIIFEDNTEGRWNWGTNVGRGNYNHLITYHENSKYQEYKNTSDDVFKDRARLLFTEAQDAPINVGTPKNPGDDIENEEQIRINYPLWDDFICPYFGPNPDGTARKVFYDSAMQQLQVLCSVTDIQNILGYAITKAVDIDSSRKKTDPTDGNGNNPLGTDLLGIAFSGNNPRQTAQYMGTLLTSGNTIETHHTRWNLRSREYYTKDAEFLLLENEIRAAMAGYDSWVYYTFNKSFTTDLGVMLRYTMMTPSGNIVTEQTQDDPETKAINEGEPVVTMVYHGSEPHIIGQVESSNPNSNAAILSERVNDMLQKVHAYVKNIGDTYYGKQFMVKVPGLSVSRDRPLTSSTDFVAAYNDLVFNVDSYKGAGRLYSNYKPATDGAWEEPGNVIDDTIVVGSVTGDFFTTDDGRFVPILGYKASYEYLNDTLPDIVINNATAPDPATIKPTDTKIRFVDDKDELTNYNSKGMPGIDTNKPAEVSEALLDLTPEDPNAVTPSTNPPTTLMILAQSSQPATGIDIIPNEWYPGLVTSLSNSEYLYYPYNFPQYPNITQLSDFTFANNAEMQKTSFDNPYDNTERTVPSSTDYLYTHLRYKIYARGEIEPNFVFIRTDTWIPEEADGSPPNPNYREPRAIVKIGSPIECNPVHLADKYVHHCFMLDSSIFKSRGVTIPTEIINGNKTKNGGLATYKGGWSASSDVITNATDHFLDAVNAIDKDADRAVTMPIAPKAAMPGFAAVPLQSQCSVYGPWTNHPWLVRKDIFTDPDISGPNSNADYIKHSVNNLVGGLKVEIAEDLCPWNFGGMRNLDLEAIARLESDASYQISQEYGTFSIPGSPVYKLGDFLDKASEYTSGPVINSIRANISEGGVTTEYSLRTFSRKFGLFNKENANRAAQISSEAIARRKAIAQQAAEVDNRRISSLKSQTLNDAPKRDYTNPPLAEAWRSSSELLVGHNDLAFRLPLQYRLKNPEGRNETNIQEGIRHISGLIQYDPSWGFAPAWRAATGINVLEYPKIFSTTQVMDSREATAHLQGHYENTAFMSLDGLLSPISFYPTENFRTYHITKYPRKACRYCFGVGQLNYSIGLPGLMNSLDTTTTSDFNAERTQASNKKSIPCPFCEPEKNKVEQLLAGSSRGRVLPPFILTSGTDNLDTANDIGDEEGLETYKTAGVVINYSTLNPATLAFGEFSAFQNRQSGDYTGHSIRMIGHGTTAPNNASDSLNQMMCGDNRLFKSNLEYDQLYLDKIKQLYNIPSNKRTTNQQKLIDSLPEKMNPFSNNARFFGFRGPMMLHGWGYDTEGYPVPNSSGEPKYDSNFNVMKATGIDDPNYVITIFKNQEFVAVSEESMDDIDPDIVLVNSAEGQGYYTEPFREPTFAKGWAQLPSTWPVGPIDLRWDSKAKLWTVPSSYKNVYVLLEEDLNNNVARGELIDNAQDVDDMLKPLGYRKVVYVRDTVGIYGAPRSAIVYCSYDEDGGFYEPVSQSTFTTSGTIVSSTTVELYKIYQKKIGILGNSVTTENEPATYIANYTNPLGLNVNPGDMALFTFVKYGWIVQAAKG